jgi:hypothetical protein
MVTVQARKFAPGWAVPKRRQIRIGMRESLFQDAILYEPGLIRKSFKRRPLSPHDLQRYDIFRKSPWRISRSRSLETYSVPSQLTLSKIDPYPINTAVPGI